MAFECTVGPGSYHTEVFGHGDESSVLVHIGRDPELRCNYSLVAGLSPMAGGDHEYYFSVIRAFDEDGEEDIWDARIIAGLISQDDRRNILVALLDATVALINQARPERFIMATHDAYLPDKAMRKYYILLRIFKRCGYDVTGADTYLGKDAWWMDRNAGNPV
jgi:hypothetical protein